MNFQMRYLPDPAAVARMTSAELRASFLVEDLFAPGHIRYRCFATDRAVIGGAVPVENSLLLPNCRELAAEFFTERRELGVINIGGPGRIQVEEQEFGLQNKEALYIGKGNRRVAFASADPGKPAQFYFVSHPAHAAHPCAAVGRQQADSGALGSAAAANRRTIHKLIHPGGSKSCQLTMGFTELAEGSVWNTMPAHTHERRSEIYFYFDLPEGEVVQHFLGEPHETRHIVVRDRQAVISPSWSLHFGVGTTNYSFVWSMAGENLEFADMNPVRMEELR